MRIWTLAAALGALSMVGCTVREVPSPGEPKLVGHHHRDRGQPAEQPPRRHPGKPATKIPPPEETTRRYRRPRQRLAGR